MDPNANSHDHLLGTLDYLSFYPQQIGLLKCSEPEEIIVKVSFVVKFSLDFIYVFNNNLINIISQNRS